MSDNLANMRKAQGAEPTTAAPTQRAANTYEAIIVERRGGVGLITLNRPKSLNALKQPTCSRCADGAERLRSR